MSTTSAIHQPAAGFSAREATERANHRVTLALFAGLIVLAALGITVSVIASSVMHRSHQMVAMSTGPGVGAAVAGGVAQHLSLYVAPEWKRGPGGARHDAFSKTDFNVKVGQQVQMTIDNRDDAVHSITSAAAGVSIVVKPGVHTYTLLVKSAGRFKWICAFTCDPFSMGHVGYMQGYITAT